MRRRCFSRLSCGEKHRHKVQMKHCQTTSPLHDVLQLHTLENSMEEELRGQVVILTTSRHQTSPSVTI